MDKVRINSIYFLYDLISPTQNLKVLVRYQNLLALPRNGCSTADWEVDLCVDNRLRIRSREGLFGGWSSIWILCEL